MPTETSTGVERPALLGWTHWKCCPWCRIQWEASTCPESCPNCAETMHEGTIPTAIRRFNVRNGL